MFCIVEWEFLRVKLNYTKYNPMLYEKDAKKSKKRDLLSEEIRKNMGKGTSKQGKIYVVTGSKVRGCLLLSPVRMNEGGRPYILGHPPLCVRAVGRNLFLFCLIIFLGEVEPAAALTNLP